jgi:two-component SAPR family response regulator
VDLIERIRHNRPEIAIVVTSGHGQPAGDHLPVDAPFLPKPYMAHWLDEAIVAAESS